MTDCHITSGRFIPGLPRWLHLSAVLIGWFSLAVLPASSAGVAPLPGLPQISTEGGYVSSKACLECHKEEYHSWHRSYHRTMSQVALPEAVKAPFDGTVVDSFGLKYRVFKKGEEFWAEMPEPDEMMFVVQGGKPTPLDKIPLVQKRVLLVTGSHHYQTFWVGSSIYPSVLQTLPLVYLLGDQRWAPRETVFMRGPDDKGRFMTQWNHHCIRCHSTGGNPGLDEATGQLNTRVGEFGIACEACHGPGEKHVALRRALAERPSELAAGLADPIVNPKKLTAERSSQVCGQCHGVYVFRDEFAMRSAKEGGLFHPGDNLHHTRYYIQYPSPKDRPDRSADLQRNPGFFAERWWENGTILAGGREYTALSATACYRQGEMSCLNCHSMHDSNPAGQMKRFAHENQQCTQCHTAPKYTTELEKHTFHRPASTGSNCLNCHMPHTSYALLKGIRSHTINVPDVRGSIEHGVPNACNLCHLDQTLAWAQEKLQAWYEIPPAPLTEEQKSTAASLLWLLPGHAAQRAITAWHFGWEPARAASGTNWMAPFLAPLLADPYGVVRYIANRSLGRDAAHTPPAYDFLAPPPVREQAATNVLQKWRTQSDGKLPGPSLLGDAQGRLSLQRLEEFLRKRDDRPISVKE